MPIRIRLTHVIVDLLDFIESAPPGSPAWGLALCEATGHARGTVYPALNRLLKAGWIADRWEDPAPVDRPRRRFYAMTPTGSDLYAAARQERASRRAAWITARR